MAKLRHKPSPKRVVPPAMFIYFLSFRSMFLHKTHTQQFTYCGCTRTLWTLQLPTLEVVCVLEDLHGNVEEVDESR